MPTDIQVWGEYASCNDSYKAWTGRGLVWRQENKQAIDSVNFHKALLAKEVVKLRQEIHGLKVTRSRLCYFRAYLCTGQSELLISPAEGLCTLSPEIQSRTPT